MKWFRHTTIQRAGTAVGASGDAYPPQWFGRLLSRWFCEVYHQISFSLTFLNRCFWAAEICFVQRCTWEYSLMQATKSPAIAVNFCWVNHIQSSFQKSSSQSNHIHDILDCWHYEELNTAFWSRKNRSMLRITSKHYVLLRITYREIGEECRATCGWKPHDLPDVTNLACTSDTCKT